MIKSLLKIVSIMIFGAVLFLGLAAPALAAQSPHFITVSGPLAPRPMFLSRSSGSIKSTVSQATSENWSGYAATAPKSTFNSVSSAWIQPTLSCTPGSTNYSAYWVGLDGFSDSTVEQIGTEANCVNGQPQYYVWYEMYPQNPTETLARIPLLPGNSVSASVTYNPSAVSHFRGFYGNNVGSFTLAITNKTTGAFFSVSETVSSVADRSSAEVITEAPYSNGILPLSNFGTVNFASSLVNGSALGNAQGLQAITMDDPSGEIATPSVLNTNKESFSITWSATAS